MCVFSGITAGLSAIIASGLSSIGTTAALGSGFTSIASATLAGATVYGATGGLIGGISGAISGEGFGKGLAKGMLIGAATGGLCSGLGEAIDVAKGASQLQQGLELSESNAILADSNATSEMVQSALETQADYANATGAFASQANSVVPVAEETAKGAMTAKDWALMGMQAAAATAQGYGSYRQGVDEEKAQKQNAENMRYQAETEAYSAETASKELARKQRIASGHARVANASNGIMLSSASTDAPSMWEQDLAAQTAWDRSKLIYGTKLKMQGYYDQANQALLQARNARRRGNAGAITSLLTGAVGMYAGYHNATTRPVPPKAN